LRELVQPSPRATLSLTLDCHRQTRPSEPSHPTRRRTPARRRKLSFFWRLRPRDLRPCEENAVEDRERVPPCRIRRGTDENRTRQFLGGGVDSLTYSPFLHASAPSRVRPRFLRAETCVVAFEGDRACRDETDRCLLTGTAVTCTRISRVSRGMLVLTLGCLGTPWLRPSRI